MGIRETIKSNRLQIAFVFMAFLLMVLTSSFFMSRIVERQVLSVAEGALKTAETSISLRMEMVSIILENAAASIQRRLDAGETQQRVFDDFKALSDMLSRRLDGQIWLTDFYGYILGEFISSSGRAVSCDFVPRDHQWYSEAVDNSGRAVFTKPYIDASGKKNIISGARCLTGWYGEFYGVIAIDVDVSAITQSAASLQFKDGSYGWILDLDFAFLAHPDENYIGKKTSLTEELKKNADKNPGRLEVIPTFLTSGSGEGVAICRRMQNGWYVGITTPVGSYYDEAYRMIAVLSALGFAFMLILSYLLVRLRMEKDRSDEENKSKSSFLAKMSHEIRTPMNSIIGMSELIMRKEILPEAREYVAIINQSGNTLLSIINDILDFSKIESGQLKIDYGKYHFSSMLNDILNVIRLRLADKKIEFLVSTDPDIPEELIGDDVRVRQIVGNLLTNAVKYTVEGFIALDVRIGRREGQSIELIFEVKDSGIGIKKENIGNLFVEFARFGKAQSIEGTGLGLAIARSYCKLMGGEISVESEYGLGSTFTASVIQAFEDSRKSAQVEKPEEKKVIIFEPHPKHLHSIASAMISLGIEPTISMSLMDFMDELEDGDYNYAFISSKYAMECIDAFRTDRPFIQFVVMIPIGDMSAFKDVSSILMPAYSISIANVLNGVRKGRSCAGSLDRQFSAPGAKALVVDDFPTNLKVAKEVIAHFGLTVDTCLSGREAISLVKENTYDIVFMDHMMPEMDGIETTAAIRAMGKQDEYYLNLPIVALTANAISGQREMFLESGMNDFLSKPIEMHKLVSIMRKWIPKGKQANPPEAAASAQLDGFEVEGLDVAAGFRNTGGSLPVYKDILLDFCRDANDVMVQLKKAELEEDFKNYAILAHSLKGAARSVGAVEIGQFAALMEESAKNGDTAAIHNKTNTLWENLRSVIENIYAELAKDAFAPENDGEDDAKKPQIDPAELEILKKALLAMDISTVNDMLMKYISMPLPPDTKALISAIEQDVLMFEYDMAIEKIGRLL
jgi:signal transduction histidine kinase/CheY-like chemotaxis protein/HPt (histidine-containing phosphotransfer) domain-containing protein